MVPGNIFQKQFDLNLINCRSRSAGKTEIVIKFNINKIPKLICFVDYNL